MWGAIGLFVLILLVKVFAKYIFYVQRDPRARNARRQEELRRRQLNAKEEKRKATGYYVSGLYIYPVKSCKGISLTSAEIGRYGFINDRRWMIVDKETNRFLTQRILPKMALISPSLLNNTRSATGKTATTLQLEAPGIEAPLKVLIPHLNPKDSIRWETSSNVGDAPEDEEIIEVTVWDDTVNAIDEGEEASQWLSKYLEREVRLVRLLHDNSRRVPEEYEVIEDDKGLELISS
jgi:uncharacterized protein YcbX